MLEANAAAGQQDGGYQPVVLLRRADIERAMGRLPEAERDVEQSLELLKRRSEPDVPNSTIGAAYLTLGEILQAQGRAEEAERALTSALQQLEPSLGANHPSTRQARALLERTRVGDR
jgi:tetratricopeptide (TPR) repeat protein